MIVAAHTPSRFLDPERGACDPGASSTPPDELPPYSMENLFADPEVRRRVGGIISKAAQRQHPRCAPAPRSGCSRRTDD
jgi:hypothetical protein